jgi:hypothetical protein
VYKVEDTTSSKHYALKKIISTNINDITNLKQQIMLVNSINNLHIVNYLKTAIIECVYNHHQIDYMTKELYPMIGLKYDCSGMSAERSMRTAIRIAVERGNSKTLGNLFGHTISIYKDNPTNSEFISIIAEKLRLQMFEMQSVA